MAKKNGGEMAATLGRHGFTTLAGVASKERDAGVAEIVARIAEAELEVIRISFVDTHGYLRSRPIEARHFAQAARNGVPFTTALFAMDSANLIYLPIFNRDGGMGNAAMGGGGDMLAVPDLSTFRILPWADKTGWLLCDLHLTTGERCPFDPRLVMQQACSALAARSLAFIAGVEVECHVLRVDDPHLALADCTQPPRPPAVSALSHGYQHMSELRVDELERVIMPIRRALLALGLPLRTVEGEWGPGQIEITLDPLTGVAAADAVVLMRAAVKQVTRRMGLIASFMTKPALPNVFSSGWHLHQSLADAAGGNAFASPTELMSDIGLHYTGGLLKHVRAATAFSNPTINGYKRLNANPLAPKRAVWANDNKGAMCRLVGGPGDPGTHIENRSGEPLANPYLYMASQIVAGLDGIKTAEHPGEPLDDDPYGQVDRPLLPSSLMDAIDALDSSQLFRAEFGDAFVSHYVGMKRQEIGRFSSYVTDWEHREYFEAY